jgi:tetratricopeptide (TPR) repeat protein
MKTFFRVGRAPFGLVSAALISCACVSAFAIDAGAQQTLVTRDTFGRPSAWDIAKNPQAMDAFAVHVTAQRFLLEADDLKHGGSLSSPNEVLGNSMLGRAEVMLRTAIGKGETDPRLQFDLGEVLQEKEGRGEEAVSVLSGALAKFPNADGAHAAWLAYAFANSKLDRPDEERRGYETFLADEPNANKRVVPLLNLAEANMRSHRLDESIEGYRDVESLSAQALGATETGVLAVWGLAVALDRQGDARGAAEQARIASRMDPESPLRLKRPIIDSDGVFFVPTYERFWYLALAATEDAKQAGNAEASAKEWRHAVELWHSYIEPAQKVDHPEGWNSIAIRHLAAAEKQLKLAEIRAKAEAKTKKPVDVNLMFQNVP